MNTPVATGHYGVRMGRTCLAHHHDSLVPMEVHHVWPLGDGGPDVVANKVSLCCNAHYSVHSLLDLYRKGNGVVPWTVRRQYGPVVRELALRGWTQIRQSS